MENFLNLRNTIIIVTLLTVWRLYLSAALQLHPDEAYYWLWSRHLDIAYFDHSPLVAYFIRFTTLISNSELWVRLAGTIVTLVLSILLWRLSLQLFGSSMLAAGSVMLFNAYPLTMLGLIVMTPDVPVILFWSLSVYIFWQIIQTKKAWLWFPLGVTFGLALLSKYTAILLIPCIFGYLLLTDDRRWLKTIYPYLALMTGLIFFLPVIYWNSDHGWISFLFQFNHGLGGKHYSIVKPVQYFASQLIVAGPVVWLLGVYAALACFSIKEKAQLFLILTSLPVIMFFGFSSLIKLAGPNWPVFAYFTFSILVTKYFLHSNSKFRRALWYTALYASFLISAIVTLHARFSLIPLAGISRELAVADATNAFYGWRELGAELQKNPSIKFAVTPSHQLSAEIIYYTNEKIFSQTDAIVARASQFNLWAWPNGHKGNNGFYVWNDADSAGSYREYSASTSPDTLTIFRGGVPVRNYRIVRVQNSYTPPIAPNTRP